MSTLEEILSQRSKDIEPPKALPAGTYLALVDGPYLDIESSEKKTPGKRFRLRLVRPIEVADMEGLTAAGGCEGKNVNNDFFITENNVFFLKQFLDHCGIEEGDKSLAQRMSEAPGRQVGAVLRNTLSRGVEPRLIHVLQGTFKIQ